MTYKAIVARIKVTEIPGAKTLAQGSVLGYAVCVDKSTPDNSLVIFFPTDGALSKEFLEANDLVSRGTDEHGNKLGGYFSANGRVTCQKFMKGSIRSEGFACPLSFLSFTVTNHFSDNSFDIEEGEEFTEFNGVPICAKYYTEATKRAMQRDSNLGIKRVDTSHFPEHVDTGQFKSAHLSKILEGSLIVISEKLHGTSGRYGNVKVTRKLNLWQRLVNKVLFHKFYKEEFYKYLLGSRRVVLNDRLDSSSDFYGSDGFRWSTVRDLKLQEGEVIYYELLGDTESGKSIMSLVDPKKVGDKEFAKRYTNHNGMMKFSYGTSPGETRLVCYRITKDGTDLPWNDFVVRVRELGLETPPTFEFFGFKDEEHLRERVTFWTDGPSTLDLSHIREGVCIRVEEQGKPVRFLKNKSLNFGILEGYVKSDANYVDMEESS